MSIFKKKFAKEQKESIVVEQEDNGLPEISSYEQEPEKVAEIVNNSLKKGYFSEISQKIESLPSTGYKRTQYVFEGPKQEDFSGLLQCALLFQHVSYILLLWG